jgi:hypothetical protein
VTDERPDTGKRSLREGWYEYAFEWTVPADADALFVSVGVSVVWESDATHFVDDVTVSFTPA